MRQKSLTDFMNEVIKDLCEQGRFATAHGKHSINSPFHSKNVILLL